jgi:hypothetical protein
MNQTNSLPPETNTKPATGASKINLIPTADPICYKFEITSNNLLQTDVLRLNVHAAFDGSGVLRMVLHPRRCHGFIPVKAPHKSFNN